MINKLRGNTLVNLVIFLGVLGILLSCSPKKDTKNLLFIGSYTNGQPSEGLYVYDFDINSGKTKELFVLDSIVNPSFITLSPDGKYLYTVTKSQMKVNGMIAAFAVDSVKGALHFLNEEDAGGRNPVHLAISNEGSYLVNSNYTDPSISVFKIKDDGSLNPYSQLLKFKDSSIVSGRQDNSHIHSTNFSSANDYLFAQDLGADKIRAFNFFPNTTTNHFLKSIESNTVTMKPGSGPRHFTFHPISKFAYGISELSGRISQYNYGKGSLTFKRDYQSYTNKQKLYRSADIHISPDGKFLYASNRAPDENSLSIFAVDILTGNLKLVGREPTYGEHPRNFVIDPSGNYIIVANQFSDNVVFFKRDLKTGKLTKLPNELKIKNPSSLRMKSYNQ
ncbi:lactonase family protein [Spongiivirga citrea]|uniref:Beta-propeller fold lactonase family protein n=1 Tax=Spongiivirga citrea TaxID=1481457 RepID=A0A6M0CPK9_9FLAO|nr:lactonase family protein [Spongiivirga citrea]NER17799.1 beta-propeller fold lactonase family protein [Spongiivirga citrea]